MILLNSHVTVNDTDSESDNSDVLDDENNVNDEADRPVSKVSSIHLCTTILTRM